MKKPYFLFDHTDCTNSIMSRLEEVISLKMWLKFFSTILVAALVFSLVLFMNREQKACRLCNSVRYHAPCLVDLETGKLIELNLYFPHKTKVAELADPQPEQETFSFVILGSVSGYTDTANKYIEINIPTSEKTTNPALCKACRKQLSGIFLGRYMLADLYDQKDKKLIPINTDLAMELRCYVIIAHEEEQGILKVTIQGNLE